MSLPDSHGGDAGAGPSRSSTPTRGHASQALSASLAAHLNKPVAPASPIAPIATSSQADMGGQTQASSDSQPSRMPISASAFHHNGKAMAAAVAADAASLADNDVWKSAAARRAERAWALQSERSLYQSDVRFKRYAATIDKCLASFDSVSEWVDFIAFLSRLLKTLQAYPQFNAIPRKLIVAKRLSQCLNPALPSGVHHRALDVYDHIFTVITIEGLRRDLAVWSPGLLPFFPSASTTVKPVVLSIIERCFLPLGLDLRILIKPLQLSLLPGLEEEAGEFFERSLKVIDKIIACVGLSSFLQVLWLQLINLPAIRLAALHFLARRLPQVNGDGASQMEVAATIGPDPGLMIRAFAAALQDASSLLVQRAMLDILVSHLRIDSSVFTTMVRKDDRVLLVHAALNVVLRRDLSLNRRLYVWLLGPSEEQDVQLDFFEKHALEYAQAALMRELADEEFHMANADRQKPIRILVSLLDKWSIGLPLTNAMIVDVFKSLRREMTDDGAKSSTSNVTTGDISTTAKMLFEAVDPFAMFRQLFFAVLGEAQQNNEEDASTDNLVLLRFMFASFRVHDEESRVIHLPTLLAALLELSMNHPRRSWKLEALQLAREILALIPKRVFANRSTESPVKSTSFVEHASRLYDENASSADAAAKQYIGFQHPKSIAALLDICGAHLRQGSDAEVVVEASSVLCALLNVLDASSSQTASSTDEASHLIPWAAIRNQEILLNLIPSATSFAEVEGNLEVLVASQRCSVLKERIDFGRATTVKDICEKLFTYMSQTTTPYHVRAVDLFWTVADLALAGSISPLLCRRISLGDFDALEKGVDIFDVLWKHSDDARLSSSIVCEPLLCFLNGLQSSLWDEKQLTEAWVRNNTRSFTLLLDPLLDWINEKNYACTSQSTTVDGVIIVSSVYRRQPDLRHIQHRLSILLQLARVGSGNFARAMRAPLSQHLQVSQGSHSNVTYGQALSDALGLLIRTDVPVQSIASDDVHALAAELLQTVISKMQVDASVFVSVQQALLERLLLDINAEVHQAQAKLLQALHGTMSLQAAANQGKALRPPTLLLPTLKAGLTQPGNRRTLQHWADFVGAMTPIYKSSVPVLLMPLNQGLCALVRTSLEDLQEAYDGNASEVASASTEAEIIAYMTMSERVLLQGLESHGSFRPAEVAASGFSEKVDPFGFMGALTNVFSTDVNAGQDGDQPSSSAVWKSLHHTVRTLHLVWLVSTPTEEATTLSTFSMPDSRVDTLMFVKSKIQSRARRYLEKLYRNHSGEVVEALIACWQASTASKDRRGTQCAFEILSQLAPSAQIVVTFLCDVISTRMVPVPAVEKTSRNSAIPVVSNGVLFAFLEAYLARLDSSSTIQVWPVVIMLIKDILSSSTQHKAQIFPALRCLTVTAERISDSPKSDDRRIRRELLDSYVRLCDLAVLIAGRSFDSTSWIGRRAQNTDPMDSDDKASIVSDPMSASTTDISSGSPQLVEAIQIYLAKFALPALRKFAADADKVASLCANIVYYVVASGLRQKKKGVPDISPAILALSIELTRHPGSIKYWRAPVTDLLTDAKFFHMDATAGQGWIPVVHGLMTNDKERFIEAVGRVSPPSTNIFTNREAETALRAFHVRRLSFAIFASPKDQWLPQLPLIQEKLVDLLRNSTTDPVVCEAYLCLRVLLARFSSQHLGSLWPVFITEMVRLFQDCLEDLPADDSDKLMLVFAASKVLDLLITLQTDEFQAYQWLFFTDTTDIVYPPPDWQSESLLDRLALAIEERRGGQHRTFAGRPSSLKSVSSRSRLRQESPRLGTGDATNGTALALTGRSKRRPFLLHHVGTHAHAMEDLQPFFANVSLHAYESTYSSGHLVDTDAVEHSLLADIFPQDEHDELRFNDSNE